MEKSFNHLEDFLTDESFRSWVLNPTPERESYWQKWLDENQDKRELVNRSREMILNLKFKTYRPGLKARQRILERVNHEAIPVDRTKKLTSTWLRVAAVLLVVVAALTFIYFQASDQSKSLLYAKAEQLQISNAPGVRSQHILPDGSTVFLNAGSTLEYPETFAKDARVVNLNGEAFFEVVHKPASPFKVLTENFSVEVLGTRFNVNNRLDSPKVALVDGKVRLKSISSEASLELKPSEMAVYDREEQTFFSTSFDYKYVTGWKDGYLVFRESSLDEVLEKLYAWYGIEIVVEQKNKASDWSYTASFRQESLENVLKNMRTLRRFDYKVRNDSLFLSFD
jgi:transmembrane sensor